MVLASEPLCLCGVDVAAPQTSRTTRRQTIAQLKDSFSAQLTPEEARYYGPIYADYLPADSFKGAPAPQAEFASLIYGDKPASSTQTACCMCLIDAVDIHSPGRH